MVKFLDLYSQYKGIKDEIDAAIADTIAHSAYIGGTALKSFEQEFAAYQDVQHCVGVGNGTDAIEIAIEALELPPMSEIIVPANSFIASSEAVTRSGCRVVFADVSQETYLLDIDDVRKKIGTKTSAIMAVHLYGRPCDMMELVQLAMQHDLRVIEDCAQAHGAEIDGKRVGAIGTIGTFSFYPGKNLGAYGDGGAIVTNDGRLAERCRMIANHGRLDKYNHLFEGRNSRLDGLQAAILRVKLRHLDKWVDRRNAIARTYLDGLAGVGDLQLPSLTGRVRHAFHLFVVRTAQRDALKSHLQAAGIETGVHYPIALPKLKAYEYLGPTDDAMFACRADERLLSLPIGEHMSDEDVRQVIDAIQAFPSYS